MEGTAPAPRLGHTASVICIAGHLHLVVFGGRSLPHFTILSRQLDCYCLLLSFILHHQMSCVLAYNCSCFYVCACMTIHPFSRACLYRDGSGRTALGTHTHVLDIDLHRHKPPIAHLPPPEPCSDQTEGHRLRQICMKCEQCQLLADAGRGGGTSNSTRMHAGAYCAACGGASDSASTLNDVTATNINSGHDGHQGTGTLVSSSTSLEAHDTVAIAQLLHSSLSPVLCAARDRTRLSGDFSAIAVERSVLGNLSGSLDLLLEHQHYPRLHHGLTAEQHDTNEKEEVGEDEEGGQGRKHENLATVRTRSQTNHDRDQDSCAWDSSSSSTRSSISSVWSDDDNGHAPYHSVLLPDAQVLQETQSDDPAGSLAHGQRAGAVAVGARDEGQAQRESNEKGEELKSELKNKNVGEGQVAKAILLFETKGGAGDLFDLISVMASIGIFLSMSRSVCLSIYS